MRHYLSARHGKRTIVATVIAYAVATHGIILLAMPLLFFSVSAHAIHIYPGRLVFDAQVLLALTLLVLSAQLRRRKQTAWMATVGLYICWAIIGLAHVAIAVTPLQVLVSLIRDVGASAAIIAGLVLSRHTFTVRSDIRTFTYSVRVSLLVLSVAFFYGVVGFLVLDHRDLHHDLGLAEAIHRTIDQVNLTTAQPLQPLSHRAGVFMDSLSLVSIAAVGYAFLSLFQPIRARLSDQSVGRATAELLVRGRASTSEDFFKLYPHDKFYYFNGARTTGVAYGVRQGVALVVGDPMGDDTAFEPLLRDFESYARVNDWSVAYVHIEPRYRALYEQQGLSVQKIGEEAVVDVRQFVTETVRAKYFRQIFNRFTKQGYTVAVLQPPHAQAVLAAVARISQDWLAVPGRKERTFMMGAFTSEYMQQGPLAVLQDARGEIIAFANQLPVVAPNEVTFDLLRHKAGSPGNSNDFLLMEFIKHLHTQGYQRVNLGLCPLSGLANDDDANSVTNNALRFLYANGDRFYSFSGLRRFKAKYDPQWEGRYIAYRGGISGFTRVVRALNRAMRHR